MLGTKLNNLIIEIPVKFIGSEHRCHCGQNNVYFRIILRIFFFLPPNIGISHKKIQL